MESWQFIESPTGAWYWLCSDALSRRTRTSTGTFANRSDCVVSDASAKGYQKMHMPGAYAQGQYAASRPARAHRNERS